MTNHPESITRHAMRLSGGTWTATKVTLAVGDDAESWHCTMNRNGWESLLDVASRPLPLELSVWCRKGVHDGDDVEPPWYLIEVSDSLTSEVPEIALADRLPDLMDVLGRWMPVVRDAGLLALIDDATEDTLMSHTYVSTIASHVRHGMGEGYDELRREQAQRARQARERLAQAAKKADQAKRAK